MPKLLDNEAQARQRLGRLSGKLSKDKYCVNFTMMFSVTTSRKVSLRRCLSSSLVFKVQDPTQYIICHTVRL